VETARFNAVLMMLDDARHLLSVDRQKRVDVDYDIRPVTQAIASRAVEIAEQVCQEIQQRSGGLSP
jgi:hypothetical protein